MQLLKFNKKTHYVILFIILILSAYVHLWNPSGFPDIVFDEGIYMRRAMTVIETGNPQEVYFYDHPYFGQLLLGGILKLIGFPESVTSTDARNSIEMLYMVPRIIMGLLAILDTFLIYKISENRFGRRIAILASVLFAVMPITWLFRRILLDAILMPFLLSSILLALYSKNSGHQNMMIVGSSVLLGLAIFTKITAVTMIPVVAYVIISSNGFKTLYKWLPPIFAIPMIWPGLALYFGQFDLWFKDVLWQSGRGTGQFLPLTYLMLEIEPVLMGLGFASIAFAIYKRELLLVLWIVPFLLFVNTIGFFQYFHYMLILPAMCVGIAFMADRGIQRIKHTNLQKYVFVTVVVTIVVYGVLVSTIIITTDVTSLQFETIRYAMDTFDDKEFTMIASPVYTWIFSDVFGNQNIFPDYLQVLYYDPQTEYRYIIIDSHVLLDQKENDELQDALGGAESIKQFAVSGVPSRNLFVDPSFKITDEGYFIDIQTDRVKSWP